MLPLIGAGLAALGLQAAGGIAEQTASKKIQENQAQNKALVEMLLGASESGQADLFSTPEMKPLIKRLGWDPSVLDMLGTRAKLVQGEKAAKRAFGLQLMDQWNQENGGGGQEGGGPLAQPLPAPGAVPPGGPVSQTIPAPGAVPAGGPTAQTLPAPGVSGLRPQPATSRTMTLDKDGNPTFTRSQSTPGITPLQIAQEGRAQEAHGTAQEKAALDIQKEREAIAQKHKDIQLEDAGRDFIAEAMTQAVQAKSTSERIELLTRAQAAAVKAGIKEMVPVLEKQIERLQKEQNAPIDLSQAGVAEHVALNGTNPKTGERVSPQQHQEAIRNMEHKESVRRQARLEVNAIGNDRVEKRAMFLEGMRNLRKGLDAQIDLEKGIGQMEDALKFMEDNSKVFATNLLGVAGRTIDYYTQNTRGQIMRNMDQAINILQSREARLIAGEKGRISNQIEQQWRSTIADPKKMTEATMAGIVTQTRARLKTMKDEVTKEVQQRGRIAGGLGVPKSVIGLYTAKDGDGLKDMYDSAVERQVVPPVFSPSDWTEVK